MKRYRHLLIALLLIGSYELNGASFTQQEPHQILVNNRILARVNGKSISTYDVVRKLDLLFYREFPEYLDYLPGRFQFYQVNWHTILEELINKELILADAQEHKIEVTAGDIREEMQTLFGPNIIANLDKAGMTFDEASKIVQGDIIIQRLLNFKVNAKALRAVTPSKVRKAYDDFILDPKNASLTQWRYQVVTIRDRTPKKSEDLANQAFKLLSEENVSLDKLIATMKDRKLMGRRAKVTVSNEIKNHEGELSETYKAILTNLEPGKFSTPSVQKSRAENTTVYRIYLLKEKTPGGVPSYKDMESKLKEKLLNDAAEAETNLYMEKLRSHFHFRKQDLDAFIPADYKPFSLQ